MKKKTCFIAFLLLCIITITIVSINVFASSNQKNSNLYLAGQIDRQTNTNLLKTSSSEIYAKGIHTVIYKEEINKILKKDDLLQIDRNKAERDEFEYLTKRESLFYYAKQAGFSLSNAQVNIEIENLKKTYKESKNFSDFLLYLEGREITENEYWIQEFENIRRDCTISDYLNSIKDNYLKKNKINNWTDKTYTEWQEYENKYISNLIAQENFRLQ